MCADRLHSKTSFGCAANDTISKFYIQMMENLPGTIAGDDIENLHDMRVASRRLRAAFKVFKDCFIKEKLKTADTLVKGVTVNLGQVRDLDVFIDYLMSFSTNNPTLEIDWLIEKENINREAFRKEMINSLDRLNCSNFSKDIKNLLKVLNKKTASKDFISQAARVIEPNLDDLNSYSNIISNEADVAGLHRMRISAKHLRYTMEAFIPCFESTIENEIVKIKHLQELLGQIHDCDVWISKIETYLKEIKNSDEHNNSLKCIIDDRTAHRNLTYKEALIYWNELCSKEFSNNLKKLIHIDKKKFIIKRENKLMDTEKDLTQQPEDVKKDQSQEIADTEVSHSPAPVKRAPAKRKVKPASVVQSKSAVDIEPEAQVEQQEIQIQVETPEKNMFDQVKNAFAAASANLYSADTVSIKMIKQFGKLDGLLASFNCKCKKKSKKTENNINKNFAKLTKCLLEFPENGDFKKNQARNLRRRVRSLRKKLSKIQG